MLKKINKLLIGILLLGLGLRLFGISHGFPFIFHPDEPAVVRSALGIRFHKNPGHFDWPHLYFYLNYFMYMGFAVFRNIFESMNLRILISKIAPIIWNDDLIFYLISRVLSAFLGTLTIIPVFLAGKNLFDKRTALFSALAFSIIPFHVWHSHYALIDVPMVFFLSWALYFGVLIFQSNDFKNYVLSGLFIGLAASTKYHGGLGALLVPLAYLMWYFSQKEKNNVKFLKISDIKNILASGVSALFGFLFGTPFALLDFDTFSGTDSPSGALWQFTNVGSVSFITRLNQIIEALLIKINDDLGYVFMFLYLIGLFILIFRLIKKVKIQDNLKLIFLYLPSVFFIFYISGFEKIRSHYYMIIYPFIALCVGYFLNELLNFGLNKIGENSWLLIILIFSIPLLFSVKRSYMFYSTDTRVELYNWLNITNIGSQVLYDDGLEEIIKKASIDRYADFNDRFEINEKDYLIFIPYSMPVLPNHGYKLRKIKRFEGDNNRGPTIVIYQAHL